MPTSLDYHKKLGLILTTSTGGALRIWNHDRKFLREISFPGQIESACFCNAEGDILVSHEHRVSLITHNRYRTKTFDFVAECPEPVGLRLATEADFDPKAKAELE